MEVTVIPSLTRQNDGPWPTPPSFECRDILSSSRSAIKLTTHSLRSAGVSKRRPSSELRHKPDPSLRDKLQPNNTVHQYNRLLRCSRRSLEWLLPVLQDGTRTHAIPSLCHEICRPPQLHKPLQFRHCCRQAAQAAIISNIIVLVGIGRLPDSRGDTSRRLRASVP